MWTNPQTGKGWTDEEEAAFSAIMEAGKMERLPAIRLYRRLRGDLKKALRYANQARLSAEAWARSHPKAHLKRSLDALEPARQSAARVSGTLPLGSGESCA